MLPDIDTPPLNVARPVTVRVELRVVAPDMEAAPPTSRVVSVVPPGLIPSLEDMEAIPITSKLVEIEAPLGVNLNLSTPLVEKPKTSADML